jgi:hypothetical protein
MTQRTRKSHNNAILNIRIPEPILAQLTTISDAQYKSVSTVVRDLIVQHIQQNQIFLTTQTNAPMPIKKPMTAQEYKFMREQEMRGMPITRPQSPSNQNQLTPEELSDWDY